MDSVFTGYPKDKRDAWFTHLLTNDARAPGPKEAGRTAFASRNYGWMLFRRGHYPVPLTWGATEAQAIRFVATGEVPR